MECPSTDTWARQWPELPEAKLNPTIIVAYIVNQSATIQNLCNDEAIQHFHTFSAHIGRVCSRSARVVPSFVLK